MKDVLIVVIVVLTLSFMFIVSLCKLQPRNPQDDQEQLEYIREWNRRKEESKKMRRGKK